MSGRSSPPVLLGGRWHEPLLLAPFYDGYGKILYIGRSLNRLFILIGDNGVIVPPMFLSVFAVSMNILTIQLPY